MANYFNLTLDTTGPSNPTVAIASGAQFTTQQLVDLTIGCGDADTTGYQMKIWGDVDIAHDTNVQATEGNAKWITFATTKQVKLSTADGLKTINLKVRDDVLNESALASDTINLDTSKPTATITGPDVTKVSKQATKNVAAFSFQSSEAFVEYKVKIVGSSGAAHDTGTTVGITNGSTNMAGTAGNYAANTPISCTINGADLEAASAGDGVKIVKVFVKDAAGNWSV